MSYIAYLSQVYNVCNFFTFFSEEVAIFEVYWSGSDCHLRHQIQPVTVRKPMGCDVRNHDAGVLSLR